MSKKNETKIKVLLVDDDEMHCVLYKTSLEAKGHFVEVANRGEEALVIIDNYKPHVIILDINMPGISGDRLISVILSMYPEIKVIMVSGNINDEVKENLTLFGAFDCLKKPVDLEHLNNIILKAVT
jgi:DNA-binding NtrC family response regulator